MSGNTTKMRILSLISVLAVLAMLFSFAPAAPAQAQVLVSPEVSTDGMVTFRYYNPVATRVQLYIESSKNDLGYWCYNPGWPLLDMSLDEATGIWSITMGPLEPEVYNYHFTVLQPPATQAINIADPSNPTWHPAGLNSQLFVHGPSMAWEDVQDVPHGKLEEVFYFSTSANINRPVTVYTPPNYDKNNRTYPTLYLSHGAGGNHVDWSTQGLASNIVDNLIAEKKIRPMVVVMTNFNGIPGSTNGYRLDLINDVVPFIEANYRVNSDPNQRAFAGLSAGGSRAANILVNSPEAFGFIGIWSSGGLNQTNMLPKLDAIRALRGIDIGVGARDFAYQGALGNIAALNYYGIPYTSTLTEGDCHTWAFWRKALYNFLSGPLFKIP